tara:strand:+ start:330 stop:485 length:156 start_codon:yes stop_codon:yes gene_type:complete
MSEDNYEETHGDTFMNQVGTGVHRVLYGITWLVQASITTLVVLVFIALIFG